MKKNPSNKFEISGRKAEEQMSYYLRNFFQSNNQVFQIDDLTFYSKKQMVQIDHLIIHPNGVVVVESKSVADRIIIKNDGQWIREYRGQQSGVRSPIIQAEIQAKELRVHLRKYEQQLPGGWWGGEFDVIVAVSDSGIIEHPTDGKIPNLLKADLVPKYIDDIIKKNCCQFLDEDLKVNIAAQRHTYLNYCKRVRDFVKMGCLPDDCDVDEIELWGELYDEFADFPKHPANAYPEQGEFFYYFFAPIHFFQNHRLIAGKISLSYSDYLRSLRIKLGPPDPPRSPIRQRPSVKNNL